MNEAPPSLTILRPELFPSLDAVVQKALARNPDDRFQSASAFIDGLMGAIEARPGDDRPPLDLTKLSHVPGKEAPGAPPPRESLNQTMAEKLSPGTIDALGRSLARALGPIARLMVKQASQQSTDVDMLITTLTSQIRTETDAATFRHDAEKALRSDQGFVQALMEAVISQTEIQATIAALVPLIGPVARVLVKRQAETAVGRDDFYTRLADAIPSKQDRETFLALRGKVSGTP